MSSVYARPRATVVSCGPRNLVGPACLRPFVALLILGWLVTLPAISQAQDPLYVVEENFSTDTWRDGAQSNAEWDQEEQALFLAWRRARYGAFHPDITSGTDIASDTDTTESVVFGDIDGDGDLDLVVGNAGGANRYYLNNGTVTPFSGITNGTAIGSETDNTESVALGDVDGDGDLDVIAGNDGAVNRLYANNGTGTPFDGTTPATAIGTDTDATRDVEVQDIDGDGDLDVVAGNAGTANRYYLSDGDDTPFSGITAGTAIGGETDTTEGLALADVDGDGDIDLVAGNNGTANRLYLNTGTATPFDGTTTGTPISTDADATQDVLLRDMDGDGDPDLIAGNDGAANRLYANNGTSVPFSSISSSTPVTEDAHATESIALVDVDLDGDLDLIAGNNGTANRLYLSNGGPAPFAGVTGSDIVTADTHATGALSVGDLDGDGDADLVAGNGAGQVNRLYLNPANGNPFVGTAGTDFMHEDGAGDDPDPNSKEDSLVDSNETRSIALGDVDGDGDIDLVEGNPTLADTLLYLNNGTDSPFSPAVTWKVGPSDDDTWAVALGDIDGDGDLDLVTGNNNQVNKLYPNNGTSSPFFGVSGQTITGDTDATHSIALGDMDGDGDLDVVAGNNDEPKRLYLNDGDASPFDTTAAKDITSDNDPTWAVALGDMDGDGDLDVVAGNWLNYGTGMSSKVNRLYLNNGTSDPFNAVTGKDLTTDEHKTTSLAIDDVDRDGDLDVVVGNAKEPNRLYLNNGTADPFVSVTGQDITSDNLNTWGVSLHDVNGDGILDLIAGNRSTSLNGGPGIANRLYLGNGTSTPFSGVVGTDLSSTPRITQAIAVSDLNGDGQPDVVSGNFAAPSRFLLNGSGPRPFDGLRGIDLSSAENDTQAVAIADIDGDGQLDVVTGNNGQANRLYHNDGPADPAGGTLGESITSDAHQTYALSIGDVDSDGDLDVVAGNKGQRNRLYLNNDSGTPFGGSDITTDEHQTQATELADIDGDGDLDLVAGNDTQANWLYSNDGSGAFTAAYNISAEAHKTLAVAVGDVDGDGDLDLVAGNENATNRLYLNGGSPSFLNVVAGTDISADTHTTASVALGDVDGDGDLDLVAGNNGQANRLYLNNGGGTFSGGTNIGVDTHQTYKVALVDVDHDGDLDLIAANDGAPSRLYLNDGTATPFTASTTGHDITGDINAVRALAAGDLDGDGGVALVTGNFGQRNRIYLSELFDTVPPRETSVEIDPHTLNTGAATVTPTATTPPGTRIDWYLTNTGGPPWHHVIPGQSFAFPAVGNDLRWRAVLASLSPALTPRIDALSIQGALLDSDGDGAHDGVDAFPGDPNEQVDSDGDMIGDNADPDDDNDGLSDLDEVTYSTNPLVADTDGDGVNDGDEVAAGRNPAVDESRVIQIILDQMMQEEEPPAQFALPPPAP